jgi:hypothetical protein
MELHYQTTSALDTHRIDEIQTDRRREERAKQHTETNEKKRDASLSHIAIG